MPNYETFKTQKAQYIERLKTVLQSLRDGDCIAFIKNKKKHVLKIKQITLTSNIEDTKIVAKGVVWKGGYLSMDAIVVDTTTGKSAGGYNASRGIAYGPNHNSAEEPYLNPDVVGPSDAKSVTLGDMDDEFAAVNYIAYYTDDYPLVIDTLVHTNTVDFTDDVLEFCIIDEYKYNFALLITELSYLHGYSDTSLVRQSTMRCYIQHIAN